MSNNPTPPRGSKIGRARARRAWGWVDEAEQGKGKPFKDRYGTLARKLPSLLQVSGLGQTLAFLFSRGAAKKDNADWLLFVQLAEHLRERFPGPKAKENVNKAKENVDKVMENVAFMRLVMEYSPTDYRSATREAAAVAEWLKRFAEGRLGTEDQ